MSRMTLAFTSLLVLAACGDNGATYSLKPTKPGSNERQKPQTKESANEETPPEGETPVDSPLAGQWTQSQALKLNFDTSGAGVLNFELKEHAAKVTLQAAAPANLTGELNVLAADGNIQFSDLSYQLSDDAKSLTLKFNALGRSYEGTFVRGETAPPDTKSPISVNDLLVGPVETIEAVDVLQGPWTAIFLVTIEGTKLSVGTDRSDIDQSLSINIYANSIRWQHIRLSDDRPRRVVAETSAEITPTLVTIKEDASDVGVPAGAYQTSITLDGHLVFQASNGTSLIFKRN